MSALAAPFPITKPEEPNRFKANPPDAPHPADFWKNYWTLDADIRRLADKQFALFRTNPRHPSLQFKKLTDRGAPEIWSARVTRKYRAMATKVDGDYVWFWRVEHDTYDRTRQS